MNIHELYLKLQGIPSLTLFENAPLAALNGFRTGGKADLLLRPLTVEALREAVRMLHQEQTEISILGKGSNLLISDRGVRGALLWISDALGGKRLEGENLCCGAGLDLFELSAAAARYGLSGAEFACGIPGSVGGAIMMNAGAYEGCMADIVRSVEYLETDGRLSRADGEELGFSYRHSRFTDHPAIVTAVTFALQKAEPAVIYGKMAEFQKKRRMSQPLEQYSAGSTFKRPEGYFAGKLISDAGLKGWQKGACAVSGKHAGFVINLGGASAQEIYEFVLEVRAKVEADSGVRLEPEIKLMGDWGGLGWN